MAILELNFHEPLEVISGSFSFLVGGGELINEFSIYFFRLQLITPPPTLWSFWKNPTLLIIANPPNLNEIGWKKKYFVLVEGFYAIF